MVINSLFTGSSISLIILSIVFLLCTSQSFLIALFGMRATKLSKPYTEVMKSLIEMPPTVKLSYTTLFSPYSSLFLAVSRSIEFFY
jgi:hypothetical protein